MNSALSKVGVESVSLTFVTGTLSRIGGHLAAAAAGKRLPERQGLEDSHLARARIDASIWVGFWLVRRCPELRIHITGRGPVASLCRHDCVGFVQRVRHTFTAEEDHIRSPGRGAV